MKGTKIGEYCNLEKAIVAEKVLIGDHVSLGAGEEKENETRPDIYRDGLCTIGENSVIPKGVTIGKNTVVSGITTLKDYPGDQLESGSTLDKAGER